jgi:HAD superfamily phosphatase (TIGR01668 family)
MNHLSTKLESRKPTLAATFYFSWVVIPRLMYPFLREFRDMVMRNKRSRRFDSSHFSKTSPGTGHCFRGVPLLGRVGRVAEIGFEQLDRAGIRGIILDLDNTVISEDDRYLSPGAEDWVTEAQKRGLKLFILSNGKRRHRVQFWSERLGVEAFSPARKPLPHGFRRAFARMQLTSAQVVVVGDSLHTDGVGAWLHGCAWIQVASLPHPPRWWETIAGRWVQFPYPQDLPLLKWETDG